MVTKIQKWGNSQGIRFPREVLRKAHISIGDDVDITVETGEIIVRPATAYRGKYSLEKLLSRMPSHYSPQEVDWGKTEGKEIW